MELPEGSTGVTIGLATYTHYRRINVSPGLKPACASLNICFVLCLLLCKITLAIILFHNGEQADTSVIVAVQFNRPNHQKTWNKNI